MRQEGFADLEGQPYPNLIPSKLELKEVIENFSRNGFGAWIVGGAVRDSLLGKTELKITCCKNKPTRPHFTIDVGYGRCHVTRS